MKLTAVEWLAECLNLDERSPNYNKFTIEKAKNMEKEQIMKAFEEGMFHHTNGMCPNEYINNLNLKNK